MSLLSTPPPSTFLPATHQQRKNHRIFSLHRTNHRQPSLTYPFHRRHPSRTFSVPRLSQYDDDEEPDSEPVSVVRDEWGEKSGPEPEPETRFTAPDPPVRDDEWGSGSGTGTGTGSRIDTGVEVESDGAKNLELKRCLVDTVYGTDFGFKVGSEVRGEVSELINQLEAANPVPNPTEVPGLLDGNWVLVYTATSELLPLLAAGSTPLLKVERISQNIDTGSSIVDNSTTLSTPFATFSFSATASFEVRSPSRIQVQFKEATFKPPEIKSRLDLPDSVDILGQKITLPPLQQLLNPVQEAASSISRTLYGLPPLKVSIPGERSSSWLIVTYLDDDLRISRGDGGLFVLVREGSPLLEL
ncbi:plastid lipid-associated protein 3, chloroplastic [Silene latifolia]|uniref:plastid lipid-associated protein 3, chloroplastic n=1 Tax=Silene latifolia TaxID=37657 RepID=UPI003D77796B